MVTYHQTSLQFSWVKIKPFSPILYSVASGTQGFAARIQICQEKLDKTHKKSRLWPGPVRPGIGTGHFHVYGLLMSLVVSLWTEKLNRSVQPYGVALWSGRSLNHRSSSSPFMSAYSGPGPVCNQTPTEDTRSASFYCGNSHHSNSPDKAELDCFINPCF